MAGTLEINVAEASLTLTAKLFAIGSDTEAESIALTEATNRKGLYTGTVVGAFSGSYHCHIFDGSSVLIWSGYVRITNAAVVHRAGDSALALFIEDDAIREDCFADDTAKYQAKIWLLDDDTGAADRYMVVWHKNGQPVVSGITSPTIQVIKTADGTDLIASTAMTEIASTGLYRYTATTTARITSGASYIVKATATIDGSTRSFFQPVGRDT